MFILKNIYYHYLFLKLFYRYFLQIILDSIVITFIFPIENFLEQKEKNGQSYFHIHS